MVIISVISIINKLSILGQTYLRLSQTVEMQILILLNMMIFLFLFLFFAAQQNRFDLCRTHS